MSTKLRWGVLSTANIGLKKVLPAMQRGENTNCRDRVARSGKGKASGRRPENSYGVWSYEELLADPDIDAIYNPLPNQFHVPWTIKAAEAGKHVLCEKPIGLTAAEARTLLDVRARTGVKICEAFMIRSFPQWLRLRELLDEGRIGALRSITGFFSYHNVNPQNIRNHMESGGGGVYDIGCYLIHASRYAFKQEPTSGCGSRSRSRNAHRPAGIRPSSEFSGGHSIFTCSTQLIPYQRIHFLGTRGRIELEIPFNAPPDRPTRLFIDSSGDLTGSGISTEPFPACDQYTLQGEAFAKAVREDSEVPVTLEDSIGNMAVIEAIFSSRKQVSGSRRNGESPFARVAGRLLFSFELLQIITCRCRTINSDCSSEQCRIEAPQSGSGQQSLSNGFDCSRSSDPVTPLLRRLCGKLQR